MHLLNVQTVLYHTIQAIINLENLNFRLVIDSHIDINLVLNLPTQL